MQDEFVNRLAMFQSRGTLNSPTNKPVWFQLMFTTKAVQAFSSLAELETFGGHQDSTITGASLDKKREEKELEDAVQLLGGTLAIWFRDQGDQTQATHAAMPISGWRHLRNQQLLEKSRQTRDLVRSVVSIPQTAAAATYCVTVATVTGLTKRSTITPPSSRSRNKASPNGRLIQRSLDPWGSEFSEVSRLQRPQNLRLT